MPNTDIIPIGSSCVLCGRGSGERHGAGCAVGTSAGRARVRIQSALAEALEADQARAAIVVLADAAADCEDDHAATQAMMTLAEAQDAFAQMQNDEATSIALDGLETLFGESFAGGGPIVGEPPAPRLSVTTLELSLRALEARLDYVNAELAQAEHHQHFFAPLGQRETVPVGEARAILRDELMIIESALDELAVVIAATPGTSAA